MERLEPTQLCWVPVPTRSWLLATCTSINATKPPSIAASIIGHRLLQPGEDADDADYGKVVTSKEALAFESAQMDDFADALRMTGELHEASLLSLLRRRYFADAIFTFAGDILISINPYRDTGTLTAALPTPDEIAEREKAGTQIPHLFVVAERAHLAMLSRGAKGKSQSILINGESGSGKTEAAKCIMRCLAQRSFAKRQVMQKHATAEMTQNLKRLGVLGAAQRESRGMALLSGRGRGKKLQDSVAAPKDVSDGDVEDVGSKIERSFLLANPLLEAFGNAATVNNHNSSRFGKYVQVVYSDDGCMTGTNTRHFFLEKSRVVRRAPGDRNFHAFHQLLAAYRAGHELVKDIGLLPRYAEQEPALLAQEEEDDAAEEEDLAAFDRTCKAMDTMGIYEDEQRRVWRVVAVVLALGEVEFAAKPVENKSSLPQSTVSNGLEHAAAMLGVAPALLEMALCFRSLRAGKRGSVSYVPVPPEKAREGVEGLVKALYASLFAWLVDRINDASKEMTSSAQAEASRRKEPLFIGVLDIFGFEVLAVNSLEQLCINYCNEVMQRVFDHHVFELEKDVYKEEGIEAASHAFRDNSPVIALLSAKPAGLLRILDEQCMMGESLATDVAFLSRCDSTHGASQDAVAGSLYYKARPRLHHDNEFLVAHFAGPVTYTVDGFVVKNTDAVLPDLVALVTTPRDDEDVDYCGAVLKAGLPMQARDENDTGRRIASLDSVGSRFRAQLTSLQQTLDSTDQHFVRCVKPNRHKSARDWDAELVLNQLKYLSVMEIVRVRSEGFPVRIAFADLVAKFSELLLSGKFEWLPGANDKRACEVLLKSSLGPKSEKRLWVLGTTKAFLRDGVMEALAQMLRNRRRNAAVLVQKAARGFLVRKWLRRRVRAAKRIQEWWRHFGLSADQAAVVIQRAARGFLARRRFERMRAAALLLQRFERARKARAALQALRAEALLQSRVVKLQAAWRARKHRAWFLKIRRGVVLFQACCRGAFVRGRWHALLESREKWASLLHANEAVVLTSMVTKTSRVSKGIFSALGGKSTKQRQLVLTTGDGEERAPRLFYVDPVTRRWKGEVPWDRDRLGCLTTSAQDFVVHSRAVDDKADKEPLWHFSDLLGPAVCWVQSMRRNVDVLGLVRDPAPAEFVARSGLAHRGALQMVSLHDAKRTHDYFVWLSESGDLWWAESQEQSMASGGCNLTRFCAVAAAPGVGGDAAFEVSTPYRPKPLVFRAATALLAQTWIQAIDRVIKLLAVDTLAIRRQEESSRRLHAQGMALLNKGDALAAKIKFKEAMDVLADQPEHAAHVKSLNQRAKCNHLLGLEDKAIDDCTAVLAVAPLNEMALATRAAAYEAKRMWPESLADYETLRAAAPWSRSAEAGLARAQFEVRGSPPDAPPLASAPRPRIAKTFSGPIARHATTALKRDQSELAKVNTAPARTDKSAAVARKASAKRVQADAALPPASPAPSSATAAATSTAATSTAKRSPASSVDASPKTSPQTDKVARSRASPPAAATPPPMDDEALQPPVTPILGPAKKPKRKTARAAAVAGEEEDGKKKGGSGRISFARALADWSSGKPDDLELRAGDEIVVTHKYLDGWWVGSCNGKSGLFPSTYVQAFSLSKEPSSRSTSPAGGAPSS